MKSQIYFYWLIYLFNTYCEVEASFNSLVTVTTYIYMCSFRKAIMASEAFGVCIYVQKNNMDDGRISNCMLTILLNIWTSNLQVMGSNPWGWWPMNCRVVEYPDYHCAPEQAT